MPLDATLSDAWTDPHGDTSSRSIEVPAGWGQGRSLFGGYAAALAYSLVRPLVPAGRRLRTAHFTLMRPTTVGQVQGAAQLVREGRSTTFVRSCLRQQGETTLDASFVCVAPREGSMRVDPVEPWSRPALDNLHNMTPAPGVLPEFLQQLEMRWATKALPYSGVGDRRLQGYFRFKERVGAAEGVLALLDVWPCPSLSMLNEPRPASTVTWTAHIAFVPDDCSGWFAMQYETVFAHDGFHTVVGRLFDAQGRLVAWTEQLVAVFD